MNCNVTLTAEEFKNLHNALCDLRGVVESMNHSMVKIDRVESVVSQFEQALTGAYRQDADAFSTKYDHYGKCQDILGLTAIWSIYEADNLENPHPYGDVVQIAYKDHWGKGPVFAEVRGNTWADLYKAADECIRASGDEHHVFIEQFTANPNEPRQLFLSTGS